MVLQSKSGSRLTAIIVVNHEWFIHSQNVKVYYTRDDNTKLLRSSVNVFGVVNFFPMTMDEQDAHPGYPCFPPTTDLHLSFKLQKCDSMNAICTSAMAFPTLDLFHY